jgi:predicted transcriptional regulator
MKNAATRKTVPESRPGLSAGGKPVARRLKKTTRNRLTLATIREGVGKTQADVARATGMQQSEVSRMERRSDVLVSTLRKYAEALGATCEVVIVFPTGHRMVVADPEEK